MTRAEYNEFRYIKSTAKKIGLPTYGCMYTIPVDATVDYKIRLECLYESWNLHPADVTTDERRFDGKERIVYIYGRTWEMNGEEHDWTELYTKEELERFEEALFRGNVK